MQATVKATDQRAYITPQDLQRAGITSARKAQRMCIEGTIKAVRFGDRWRIDRAAFNAQYGTNI